MNWLIRRITDRALTQILPGLRENIRKELEAREDEGRREVRALVREMEDVLEKLTLQAARESKRRSREAKAAIQPVEDEQQLQPVEPMHQLPPSGNKADLYARYGHMLHRRQ